MSNETMNDPWETLEEPSTRTPRSLETRDRDTRKRQWVEPTMLPDPEPEDGYVFKWVRASARGQDDKTNFQKRLREGWETVHAEHHPEMMTEIGVVQKTGMVEVGGLVLCKMPQEMADQRRRYYHTRTASEMDAAENTYMRDDDERMKKYVEKRKQVLFGR